MHTTHRGRPSAAAPAFARPRGRKRRPTPMVWRAGTRFRHDTRLPLPDRLLLTLGAACAAVLLFRELSWI